jgi:hypothetical protein
MDTQLAACCGSMLASTQSALIEQPPDVKVEVEVMYGHEHAESNLPDAQCTLVLCVLGL